MKTPLMHCIVALLFLAILTLGWAKKSKISMGPALKKFPGYKLWIEDHLNWLWFLFGGQWVVRGVSMNLLFSFSFPVLLILNLKNKIWNKSHFSPEGQKFYTQNYLLPKLWFQIIWWLHFLRYKKVRIVTLWG